MKALLERLDSAKSWDTRHERALALMTLGRVHHDFRRRPADALDPFSQAEALFKALEKEGQLNTTNRAAVFLGWANALGALGRFEEAIEAAEEGLALDRQRGDSPAAARGLGQIASILAHQGRFQEAEARYAEVLEQAKAAGDDEAVGTTLQHLGNMALQRGRAEEAGAHLRDALAAHQRARDEWNQRRVLNSLGIVDAQRDNPEAALAWFEQSLRLATKLGDVEGQADSRGNRGIVFSGQAEAAGDPQTSPEARHLLSEAIAEQREALRLEEQLGQCPRIAQSHSNLANSLRQAGLLDEAETHAQEALAIREKIGDPETWRTLSVLEDIAEARADAGAAAEYRRRKEAAQQETQQRAGTPSIPPQAVEQLLQVALSALARKLSLDEALSAADAEDDLMAAMDRQYPWLAAHLRALAAGESRPVVDVPAAYAGLVDGAWDAVE